MRRMHINAWVYSIGLTDAMLATGSLWHHISIEWNTYVINHMKQAPLNATYENSSEFTLENELVWSYAFHIKIKFHLVLWFSLICSSMYSSSLDKNDSLYHFNKM